MSAKSTIVLLLLAGGCSRLLMSPKDQVKADMRSKGTVLAEWVDKEGYDNILRRDGERLNHYYIRTYPYVEPELVGYVDPSRGSCTTLLRTDGSGWQRRPGGTYRYERATQINFLPSDCSEFRDTPAWPHVARSTP